VRGTPPPATSARRMSDRRPSERPRRGAYGRLGPGRDGIEPGPQPLAGPDRQRRLAATSRPAPVRFDPTVATGMDPSPDDGVAPARCVPDRSDLPAGDGVSHCQRPVCPARRAAAQEPVRGADRVAVGPPGDGPCRPPDPRDHPDLQSFIHSSVHPAIRSSTLAPEREPIGNALPGAVPDASADRVFLLNPDAATLLTASRTRFGSPTSHFPDFSRPLCACVAAAASRAHRPMTRAHRPASRAHRPASRAHPTASRAPVTAARAPATAARAPEAAARAPAIASRAPAAAAVDAVAGAASVRGDEGSIGAAGRPAAGLGGSGPARRVVVFSTETNAAAAPR